MAVRRLTSVMKKTKKYIIILVIILLLEICIAVGVGIVKKKGVNDSKTDGTQKKIENVDPGADDTVEEGFEEGIFDESDF